MNGLAKIKADILASGETGKGVYCWGCGRLVRLQDAEVAACAITGEQIEGDEPEVWVCPSCVNSAVDGDALGNSLLGQP